MNKLSKKFSKAILGSALSAALVVTVPMMAISQTATAATAADNLTAAKRLNSLLSEVKINSMTANFSQTTKGVSSTSGIKNGTFTGTMSVQRPNQFRWETKSPSEELIVGNSNTLWIYDKALGQVTQQNASKQMSNTPALLLSGDPKKISDNFTITQPNEGIHYYVLYPKSSNAEFQSLVISFVDNKPRMMELEDTLGQTTKIRFSNVKLNTRISNSQFSFTPPAGVEVIKQ